MAERQSCKLKVLGSVPSGGFFEKHAFEMSTRRDVCPIAAAQDSLAERSKAVAQGAIPQGRGFEPHSCHFAIANNTEEKNGKNTPGQDRTGDLQRVRLTS